MSKPQDEDAALERERDLILAGIVGGNEETAGALLAIVEEELSEGAPLVVADER